MLISSLSQLVGMVCVSAALAVVALLIAVWGRHYSEGLYQVAEDAADGD